MAEALEEEVHEPEVDPEAPEVVPEVPAVVPESALRSGARESASRGASEKCPDARMLAASVACGPRPAATLDSATRPQRQMQKIAGAPYRAPYRAALQPPGLA